MSSSHNLGSIISSYNNRSTNKKIKNLYNADINDIVKRLQGYSNYKKQLYREKKNIKRRDERKATKKLKKLYFQKTYSKKAVGNPYLPMYQKTLVAHDPNLLKQYKTANIYSLFEFRHLLLPKSGHQITAGQAWGALGKCWQGYRITTDPKHRNQSLQLRYAAAVQKWASMLELPAVPDFYSLGLSKEGYKNAKLLKEYFDGYESEVIGD